MRNYKALCLSRFTLILAGVGHGQVPRRRSPRSSGKSSRQRTQKPHPGSSPTKKSRSRPMPARTLQATLARRPTLPNPLPPEKRLRNNGRRRSRPRNPESRPCKATWTNLTTRSTLWKPTAIPTACNITSISSRSSRKRNACRSNWTEKKSSWRKCRNPRAKPVMAQPSPILAINRPQSILTRLPDCCGDVGAFPSLPSEKLVLRRGQRHYTEPALPDQRRIGKKPLGFHFG